MGPLVYCVGDVHGDMESFVRVLLQNGIVDVDGHWSAGAATLIQMGDVLDGKARAGEQFISKTSDVDVLRFLRILKGEAVAAGGDVRCLLGNHEVMNLLGQFDYVAPADMPARADMSLITKLIADMCELVIFHRRFVFCHAGVSPELTTQLAPGTVRGIASLFMRSRHADRTSIVANEIVAGTEGLTTNRYYFGHDQVNADVYKALDDLDCDRMFVGHNYTAKGITTRCMGRVVLVDTGISRAMSDVRTSEMVVIEGDSVYGLRDGVRTPI